MNRWWEKGCGDGRIWGDLRRRLGQRAAVLFIAEMGGKLGIEDTVDEALFQLGKQAVGPE